MPGSRSFEYETIRLAFARSWRSDRLEGDLETRFEDATQADRRYAVRRFIVALTIINLLCLLLDFDSQVLPQALILRLGLNLPIALLSIWILRKRTSPLNEGFACILPVTSIVLTATCLSRFAIQSVQAEHYLFAAAVLISIANIRLPLRMRHAVGMTFVNILIYITIALLPLNHARGLPWDFLGFTLLLSTSTLHVAYQSERSRKDSFLLGLRDQLQTEDLQKACDELSELSYRDALTGISNRRRFEARLDVFWEEACRTSQPLSMLMIDVDFFKQLNDGAGHSEGDACLRTIAQTIDANIRFGHDFSARFGGEEFVVLLPGCSSAEANLVAEKIRLAVCDLGISNPGLGSMSIVTVSVGVATYVAPMEGDGSSALLMAADAAMYQAKQEGRNRVRSASSRTRPACSVAA